MKNLKRGLSIVMTIAICAALFSGCSKKTDNTAAGNAYEGELISSDKIIIGTSADYPPYESLNTSGEVEGFDVDMINEIAKYMSEGGNPVKAEFKNMDFDTIVSALQAGQVDIGVSAFTYDPERDVQFSTPYLISEQVVTVTADSGIAAIAALEGKKVGAGLGTTGEKAANDQIPGVQITSGDYNILFEALKNGALEAVVCDGQVAKNFAEANGFVVLEQPLISEENSIIVKNGNDELLKAVNDAVAKFMESEEYKSLQIKWGILEE